MSLFVSDTDKLNRKLIDEANVIFLYLDSAGNIRLSNRRIEEIIAKSKQELIGKFWLDILFTVNNGDIKQQMFRAVMEDTITYKRPNIYEGLITDSEGRERFISWNITPVLSDLQDLEGVILIGSDVSPLKESEASLKNIDDTLKNIFASIKEYALYVINLNGNITYYGMGSELMFGWQKNDVIFKDISTLFPHGDSEKKIASILAEVKRLGRYELETDLVKKSGERFPVILSASRFIDTNGSLTGYIFIAKDITERKRLEYQIFQAEKLAAIGQLSAGMAHEINNPLFVISGRLEMILEEKLLDESLRVQLNIILEQAERIRNLVNSLLMFSRQSTPKSEVLNINDAIRGVLPFLAYHKLPSVRVEIEADLAKDLPLVKGDFNQLQEVFLNLLINAYQAMPQGGKVQVKTARSADHQFAEIYIKDNGCGISERNLKNIFMPFFSTKKEGTGLGLSICYNIVKNHNGAIDIESEVDKGTTFIIKLPFVK